jgi:preprotein translocase subunit SecF
MAETMNRSVNETLSRTILTSLTVIICIIVLMALGGPALHDFAVAMMVGVITGTFSSIYVASPIVLFVHEYQARRKKAAATA